MKFVKKLNLEKCLRINKEFVNSSRNVKVKFFNL